MKRAFFVLGLFLLLNFPLTAAKEKGVILPPEKLAEANQLTKKGDSLLARKFYEDAILEYQKVVAINPLDHVVHNKLGIAYHQVLNFKMAKKQYERAKK